MEESQELEKLPRVVTGVLKNRVKHGIDCLGGGVDYCVSEGDVFVGDDGAEHVICGAL